MGILNNEIAIEGGNYQIANSLRFQSASSQYLSRTPGSASNRTTWTWSGWVKRGTLGSANTQALIYAGTTTTGVVNTFIGFNPSDQFIVYSATYNQTTDIQVYSSQVFRDPSAWYHIIVAIDTTQATAANRVKVYVNGTQITSFGTANYPNQNYNTGIDNNVIHYISNSATTSFATFFDGYLAEVNFIDGQALTPSSFGTTDPTSGQWVAKKYTGTYGTNGFYLPFSNGTSTTTLGADSSGNGNNWTLTNFTRSAGVSDCWMVDVPSGNGYGPATQPSSNYAVLNPLDNGGLTITKANLTISRATNSWATDRASVGATSGKWYWEYISGASGTAFEWIGVGTASASISITVGSDANGYAYNSNNGNKINNNSGAGNGTAYGATYTSGDVIGIALDLDGGTLTFYKNNVSQGTAFTGLSGTFFPMFSQYGTLTGNANFGQRSFAYTPPSGYKALCTANLPVATIKQGNKYMDATLYSGNSSTQTITNAGGFQPDLVWVKSRSAATDHKLTDSVRGATKALISDTTGAETTDTTGLTAFNSNGFTLGASTVYNNGTGPATYVGWQWQAGQGTTSSNTNGSITSTVSVNATAGFSIVTYTGTGANATVGHGLGVAPKMIIVKSRNNAQNWWVYQASQAASPANGALLLNTTAAYAADINYWNNTVPTSSVFSIGTYHANAYTYVAYCFAEIAGFSKFGSYTGNASTDGAFNYLGFRPKYIMIKNTTTGSTTGWVLMDTSTKTYNVDDTYLSAESSNAEATSTTLNIDFLSNGFKVRGINAWINASTNTYVFMAFAENPFAQANAR